mmetsp:Transcript_120623/g.240192  ORF Transcript_120623/g.240192 Transcript_120623/m.240192 type:complete len:361 (+) Transcript_120623:104-1186(+)|eukprot:CAMPEP_0172669740 /NCGR_PEP_ID=MMETSP1074-20121228/9871_1 /TAXON_ID=2916 /ORGANISM="Ceratium fusus, Strain PA161109" /LENGTH=360 /DNA_ID=CAMNT_0013486555 /DNA_START=81 /DNA_END=1163 /DNA_ORIENTATION=+
MSTAPRWGLLLLAVLVLPQKLVTATDTLGLFLQPGDEMVDDAWENSRAASEAAHSARRAARVAKQVARHSMKITRQTQAALKKAGAALHGARVETEGLSQEDQEALREAQAKMREASETAKYGRQGDSSEERAIRERLENLRDKLSKHHKKRKTELEQMRDDLRRLREELKNAGTSADQDQELEEALDEIDRLIQDMEEKGSGTANDELKADYERLRAAVKRRVEGRAKEEEQGDARATLDRPATGPSVDTDMDMPYGEMEPFGREDTAQELTEASIQESDAMVDQLERAEVAEEKRAVFRALTRLRGAAITSFDGVARAQTGNIDEYAKQYKWRKQHPIRHLAQQEADVSKWAFPSADI